MSSPFLALPESTWLASNHLAFAIRDGHPVSPGHALIITRRLVPSWFDATPEEQHALLALLTLVRDRLTREIDPPPDAWNIGINAGPAAGQTVPHLHVHLIPRYRGDVSDPRGGVRHVIPHLANYLAAPRPAPLATGGRHDPFLDHLLPLFARADRIAIVAAFLMDSGLDLLRDHLFAALRDRHANARILTSNYLDFTAPAALERLLDWTHVGPLEARVIDVTTPAFRARASAFHPKSWRFEGKGLATAFVGSSNVSESALLHGIEWNLSLDHARDPDAYARITAAFDDLWSIAHPLTAEWIAAYAARRRPLVPVTTAPPEEIPEPPPRAPDPHAIQRAALDALARAREDGARRALVVLATGLGKTWLAAFDVRDAFPG